MNILFVSDVSISQVIGGAERVLFEQSTRLAGRGHNVHILTRRLPEHVSDRETIHHVHEWRYDVDQGNALSFIISTIRNSRSLFETINHQEAFNCINFHQPFSALGVIRSASATHVKKIYTCHSLSHEEYQSRNRNPQGMIQQLLHRINGEGRRIIEKKALAASEKIIVLSHYTQDKLCHAHHIPTEKIMVIPGGVDVERFHPAKNRRDLREPLDIPADKTVLFTVRNLVPRMGLENLITAMQQIISALPDVLLIIGGSGPLRDDLISRAQKLGLENRIRFAGFIREEQLPDYYNAADAFVLPTLALEGFGLVTLEALASGTPVLGTPVGGTKEILEKLNAHYLFADTRPESMASLIVEFCHRFKSEPSFWQNTSEQCRAFVLNHYSWERNVDALEEVFRA